MKRNATAVWTGSGKEGKGHISTTNKVLNNTPYSYASRFENGEGTNPEELLAAAHAGCFTMKLSFVLGAEGFTPETLTTTCEITLDSGAITHSHLIVRGEVPGIASEGFAAAVKEAALNCPVSKLFKAKITAEGILEA